MMQIHEFSGAPGSIPAANSELPAGWPTDGAARWVRVVDPTKDELEILLRAPALQEDAWGVPLGTGDQPRVAVSGPSVFVTLPVLVDEAGSTSVLRLVYTSNTLISIEDRALPAIDRVVAELHHYAGLASSLPGLLIDVVQAAITAAGPVYLALRRRIDELAQEVEDHPLDVSAETLLAAKRLVASISTTWEDQMYCSLQLQRRLPRIEAFHDRAEQLRDLVSDADRGVTVLARLADRVRELRDYHEHSLQEETNQRLKVLTILSSIYLPATLIAGIYGMNFEFIPLLKFHFGYFFVLGLMAVLVLGQIWYFYRRGWFR